MGVNWIVLLLPGTKPESGVNPNTVNGPFLRISIEGAAMGAFVGVVVVVGY